MEKMRASSMTSAVPEPSSLAASPQPMPSMWAPTMYISSGRVAADLGAVDVRVLAVLALGSALSARRAGRAAQRIVVHAGARAVAAQGTATLPPTARPPPLIAAQAEPAVRRPAGSGSRAAG
jgi:hypothetical protein